MTKPRPELNLSPEMKKQMDDETLQIQNSDLPLLEALDAILSLEAKYRPFDLGGGAEPGTQGQNESVPGSSDRKAADLPPDDVQQRILQIKSKGTPQYDGLREFLEWEEGLPAIDRAGQAATRATSPEQRADGSTAPKDDNEGPRS